ncbi:MAG: hypothetical protein ABIO79_13490 [Ferruginibacter sp.]
MKILCFSVLLFLSINSFAQLPNKLIDGREHKYCSSCRDVVLHKPAEVLFGIQINTNGDIYFLMNDPVWFNKIFKNDSYGVAVDLVSKDRYSCKTNAEEYDQSLPKGTMLLPVYRPELVNGFDELSPGNLFVKIGKVPPALMNKQIEGNLVIMNGTYICYYTNFINIDRSAWQLLPMGLFTDSLVQHNSMNTDGQNDFFTYTKKIQLDIPFEKASASFNSNYLERFYDSVELTKYNIRKIEVRAYSSIEGPEKVNADLMNRRANTIVQTLKIYQPALHRIKVLTAENWLDFFAAIEETTFSDLQSLTKVQIKQKLTDRYLLDQIEPLLSKHRKAVVTMYLETKTTNASTSDASIVSGFERSVLDKDIQKARIIQKELVERIIDNKMPLEYISRLEVPETKEFSSLLNDREVYKYLLKATSEYEALDNLLALQKLDPENGKINYNICALQFFMWQYGGDTLVQKTLLKNIHTLPKMGISNLLVKRMLINYHILKCEENMKVFNYAAKDNSLHIIHEIYTELSLNDEDIYSLAKYYVNYAHYNWAEEIIEPRIDKLDVTEDLIFYYINLQFYNSANYDTENFKKAVLNAVNLNDKRFCNFFLPYNKTGAGMQLLDYEELKTMYCEYCR